MCLAGNTSTVFFIGNAEKIKTFLPDSGMALVVNPRMPDIVDHLKDLGAIVNGKELGFVINENSMIDSIRKVNVQIGDRPDVEPLLTGDNHKYACLSLFTDAFVFYFPPTCRNLHIFHKGKHG